MYLWHVQGRGRWPSAWTFDSEHVCVALKLSSMTRNRQKKKQEDASVWRLFEYNCTCFWAKTENDCTRHAIKSCLLQCDNSQAVLVLFLKPLGINSSQKLGSTGGRQTKKKGDFASRGSVKYTRMWMDKGCQGLVFLQINREHTHANLHASFPCCM